MWIQFTSYTGILIKAKVSMLFVFTGILSYLWKFRVDCKNHWSKFTKLWNFLHLRVLLHCFRLETEERSRKIEVSELKLRYDNRVSVISDELTMVQGQVSRFKRERDTFKHMLEAAQKTISDLKVAGATPRSSLSLDDVNI